MKIAIYTISQGQNYGNRLQNYAVVHILKNMGARVKCLQSKRWDNTLSFRIKLYCKRLTGIRYDRIAKRMYNFKVFNKKYIKYDKTFIEDMNKEREKYDIYIAGSDQIWNPEWYQLGNEHQFLDFVKKSKKIALAASFGVDNIESKEIKKEYKAGLESFDAITVRESSGKVIIKELIDKEVKVLMDPVFALYKEEWKKIEEKPKHVENEKFILCYLLGMYQKNVVNIIRKYGEQKGVKIVFLEDAINNINQTSDEEFSYGPEQFLWLLSHCEKVITDSFHAAAFSILYKKRLSIISRPHNGKSMSTRFENLAEKFEIKNLFVENYNFDMEVEIDYDKSKQIIDEERKKIYDYLRKNLK